MSQNNDEPEVSKTDQGTGSQPLKPAGGRRILSLSQLRSSPSQTVEDVQKRIREKRFAELTPRQAGTND